MGKRIYNLEFFKELAIKRGGKCLSTKYVNSHTKLLWMCNNGHKWEAKPSDIKNLNHWCPVCNESLGERKLRIFFDSNNIKFIREKKFNDCRGEMRMHSFDFYLPKYNSLIEYDGKQHYMPVNFCGCSDEDAQKTYIKLKNNDMIKNKYCLNNNIKLIRIPYTIKNVEEYLNEQLQEVSMLVCK